MEMEMEDKMKVTFNISRKEYELYKRNLIILRRTPTSDLVGHIRDVNEFVAKEEEKHG